MISRCRFLSDTPTPAEAAAYAYCRHAVYFAIFFFFSFSYARAIAAARPCQRLFFRCRPARAMMPPPAEIFDARQADTPTFSPFFTRPATLSAAAATPLHFQMLMSALLPFSRRHAISAMPTRRHMMPKLPLPATSAAAEVSMPAAVFSWPGQLSSAFFQPA
jgi:hypothetical protein